MTINPSGLDVRCWNGVEIQRRPSDGYVNATAMCAANNREWFTYHRSARTKAYVKALGRQLSAQTPCGAAVPQNCGTGIHGSGLDSIELIQVIQGGPPHLQGTWIHPRLAVDLARWISPDFAVWMDGWFLEAAAGQGQATPAPVAIPHLPPETPPAPAPWQPRPTALRVPEAWNAMVDAYAEEVEAEQEALPEWERSRSRRFARPVAQHFMQWVVDRHAHLVIGPGGIPLGLPQVVAQPVAAEPAEPEAVVLSRRSGRPRRPGGGFQPGDRLAGPELARLLGIDAQTLNDWARRQPLGAVRDGWKLIARGKFACGPMGSTVPPGAPSWLFEKL